MSCKTTTQTPAGPGESHVKVTGGGKGGRGKAGRGEGGKGLIVRNFEGAPPGGLNNG